MIIRCHHLRELGITTSNCCAHCHVRAGCCCHTLSTEHKIIYCCNRTTPFTPEEIEAILAKIPAWEEREKQQSVQQTIIPERFRPAYAAIQRLERDERYLSALISDYSFMNDSPDKSNLAVQIIVNEKVTCRRVSHPVIGDVTLNLTFLSLEQLDEHVRREIDQRNRLSQLTIARQTIVFDKSRQVYRMQAGARELQPPQLSVKEQRQIQFSLDRYNGWIAYRMQNAPTTAALIMNGILPLCLAYHYQLQQYWPPLPYYMLIELHKWDPELAQLVDRFQETASIATKFELWTAIINYIQKPLQALGPFMLTDCTCSTCQRDLAKLLEQ